MFTREAAATPAGWKRREAPGRRYPVVFTRKIAGLTYRIAPDTGGGWTVDVHAITGWELAKNAPRNAPSPEAAAAAFLGDQ